MDTVNDNNPSGQQGGVLIVLNDLYSCNRISGDNLGTLNPSSSSPLWRAAGLAAGALARDQSDDSGHRGPAGSRARRPT